MVYLVLGDDGTPLDAHLDVVGNDIIFHSRGGTKGTPSIRNQDYGPALRLLLERLAAAGAQIEGAWVDSSRTAGFSEAQRSILSGPELLSSPAAQFSLMSEHMRLVGRPAGGGYGGSTTKRIRIRVSRSFGATLAEVLGVRWEGDPPDTGGKTEHLPTPPALVLLTDLAAIDEAMRTWLDALEEGARSVTSTRRWVADGAFMLTGRPSRHRSTALEVELGARTSGEPWTVQLNAPRRAADGLTSVAVNTIGERILLRQGRLQANPDSSGPVTGEAFRKGAGLSPVPVADRSTPQSRDWYVVANLAGPSAGIRRQTAAFVHACARARAASLGLSTSDALDTILGSDEKGGSFFRKPVAARAEQEVIRLQGEVWLALRRRLEAAGIVMNKLRHEEGYEVDGVIYADSGRILLEIKTGTSAADIYEGVGQLMIYGRLLKLTDHRLVLLLPIGAPSVLLETVADCGIEVHHFEDRSDAGGVDIWLSDDLLEVCGLPRSAPVKPH